MPSDLKMVIVVGGRCGLRRVRAPPRRARPRSAIRRTGLRGSHHDVAGFDQRRRARIHEQPCPRDQLADPSHADRAGTRRPRRRARRRRPSASSSTGVGDEVTSTIRSAPRTASSADSAATIGAATCPAHVRRRIARGCAACGDQTRTSFSARTSANASRWLRACTPLPMIASVDASAWPGSAPTPPTRRPCALR